MASGTTNGKDKKIVVCFSLPVLGAAVVLRARRVFSLETQVLPSSLLSKIGLLGMEMEGGGGR